jgi:excisionase family DNA binding protein
MNRRNGSPRYYRASTLHGSGDRPDTGPGGADTGNSPRERNRSMSGLRVELPPDVVEALVEQVAAMVLERLAEHAPAARSEYLTVAEAAEVLRAKPQRVYDLLSAGRLTRYRDGSRVLIARVELDAHLGAVDPPMIRRGRGRMSNGDAR